MPAADVKVLTQDGEITGRGYAEVLELTIPPWRLPIDELRWGRCVGDDRSIVWIDWNGTYPLTIILDDGVPVRGSVTDEAVLTDDVALGITDRTVLRSATIGDSIAQIPLLSSIVPRRLRTAAETKWSARGTIRRGEQNIDAGWIVHELVRFS